jgi:hypothetical protein
MNKKRCHGHGHGRGPAGVTVTDSVSVVFWRHTVTVSLGDSVTVAHCALLDASRAWPHYGCSVSHVRQTACTM